MNAATKRLVAFARKGKFGAHYYARPNGSPLASVQPSAVVLLASSIEEATEAELRIVDPGERPTPEWKQIQGIIRAAEVTDHVFGARKIKRHTVPDEHHVQDAIQKARSFIESTVQSVIDSGGLASHNERWRWARMQGVRDALDDLERRTDNAWHRIDVQTPKGPVTVDLRLVHAAMEGLGAKSGMLFAHDPDQECVLRTKRGIAVVMPVKH